MKSNLGWWIDLEDRTVVFEELLIVAHRGHHRVSSLNVVGLFSLRVSVCVIATDLCAFHM
jgi:hypothetical protein